LRTCKNCTLNDKIFSVRINEDGICNYCLQGSAASGAAREDVTDAEKRLTEAFSRHTDCPYQVLLAYSGGKDSTFTLYTLRKKYGVSVLALTFDNGFLTEQCRKNIHEVTARLGVDSITVGPSFMRLAAIFNLATEKEIFPKKALERASSVCTACIGLVKAAAYHEAILRKIPFVCFGWTPGQAPVRSPVLKLDYRMILANESQIREPIVRNLGEDYEAYFSDPKWFAAHAPDVPTLLYPLVFSHYDEAEILAAIEKLGWERPADTDMNSTNCLLNSYANEIHMREYGFNPYSFEIAGLVREGYMSREEGLRKLSQNGDGNVIANVREKLGRYPAR
jgi:tRNA(Ile)-lysidine synthase TilS/MesJ